MLVWVQGLSGEGVAGSRHARTIIHVVEGRHVWQPRALRPQVCPPAIPGENSLFVEKRGGFRKKAVSDTLHIYEG